MSVLSEFIKDPKLRKEYCVEQTITNIAELIARHLEASGMSQRELATQLELSEGRISQLLDGEANMTLRTVASVLAVFGHVLVAESELVENSIGVDAGRTSWLPIEPYGFGAVSMVGHAAPSERATAAFPAVDRFSCVDN